MQTFLPATQKTQREHCYTLRELIVELSDIALRLIVRRHINWNTQGPDLKEGLAHLVKDIKRRVCGIASAGIPSFSV